MNDPLKPAATPAETHQQARVEAATATPTPTSVSDDAQTAPLEQMSALLLKVGPVEALRVLSAMSNAVAKEVRAQNGDGEVARVWRSSSEGMAKLAASLGGARDTVTTTEFSDTTETFDEDEDDAGEGQDDDDDDDQDEEGEGEGEGEGEREGDGSEEGESTATPTRAPRKERTKMRRMVAGMFDVATRVNVCRLREVNEMGGRGELVGRVNEQGIEQTEWPIAQMTAERLQNLTRHRGGKYMFEWFGRDENGARAALGRSIVFKVRGEKKSDEPRPPPAIVAAAAPPEMMTTLLAMQKHSDERMDRERERYDREKEREHDLRKHRETLASKERIERLSQQTRIAELRAEAAAEAPPPGPSGPQLNEAAIAAYLERLVSDRLARVPAATPNPADELGIPKWLQEMGVNKDMLAAAKPFLKEQLANLPSLLTKMGAQGGPIATPTASTTPYPAANVSRFVPKGGTGG